MITRKIAEQVLEQFKTENCCYASINQDAFQFSQKDIDEFIDQFPDEPTPDEMLAEMREWASKSNIEYNIMDNSYKNNPFFSMTIDKPFIYVSRIDRTEAITEAYRQFKEATRGDN